MWTQPSFKMDDTLSMKFGMLLNRLGDSISIGSCFLKTPRAVGVWRVLTFSVLVALRTLGAWVLVTSASLAFGQTSSTVAPVRSPPASPALEAPSDPRPDNSGAQPSPTPDALVNPLNLDLRLEELKVQKDQIQKNFEQKNLECTKKFAVTGCKMDALHEKNELLSTIKKEEAQISQAQKRIRREQKLQEISARESPQELERAKEKAKIAQDNFNDRMKAHDHRLQEHETKLNAEGSSKPMVTPEQRALERQAGVKSAQEMYDEKIKQANEHRQEQQQRLATKTLHPKPLPVPAELKTPEQKPTDAPRPSPSPSPSASP